MAKLTKKKAGDILAHLPAAFEEIQNRGLIDQGTGDGVVTQLEVADHYDMPDIFKEEMKGEYGKQGQRYSNDCMCFGAHMHVELWFASMKAFKMAEPDGISAIKERIRKDWSFSLNAFSWDYENGKCMLEDLLDKFPEYRDWVKDRGNGCYDHLSTFLHEECGAPEYPFGVDPWMNTTPVEVLTKLNKFIGIETVEA